MSPKKIEDGNIAIDPLARSSKGLRDEEREIMRRQALCSVIERSDRIMIGHDQLFVTPCFFPDEPPGWTNGETIYLNFAKIDAKDVRSLIGMWGLNWHEYAHCVITPRLRYDNSGTGQAGLRAWSRRFHHEEVFNIVEDWRIETWFSSLFSAVKKYFRTTFALLVIEEAIDANRPEWKAYPLTVGRFYLDTAIRERYKRAFARQMFKSCREDEIQAKISALPPGDEQLKLTKYHTWLKNSYPDQIQLKGRERAEAIQEAADEYVQTYWSNTDPNRNIRNCQLVEIIEALLPLELLGEDSFGLPGKGSAGGTAKDVPTLGEHSHELAEPALETTAILIEHDKERRKELEELLKNEEIKLNEESAKPSEQDGEKKAEEEGSGGDGTSAPKFDQSETVFIDLAESREEGDRDPEVSPNPPPEDTTPAGWITKTAGESKNSPGVFTAELTDQQREMLEMVLQDEQRLREELEEVVNETLHDPRVRRDIDQLDRAVRQKLGEGLSLDSTDSGKWGETTVPAQVESKRIEAKLKRIQTELSGTWVDDQTSGSLNLTALINALPSQKIYSFRGWLDEHIDEAKIEVVVLLDCSGSMSGVMRHASLVCWMLAHAVQEADGKLTVIGFSDADDSEILIGRNDALRADRFKEFPTKGGTHIKTSLRTGRQILASSPYQNKLLVTITDGWWSDLEDAIREVRRINADGAESLLVLLGGHDSVENRRGHRHVAVANGIEQAGRQIASRIEQMGKEVLARINSERGLPVG